MWLVDSRCHLAVGTTADNPEGQHQVRADQHRAIVARTRRLYYRMTTAMLQITTLFYRRFLLSAPLLRHNKQTIQLRSLGSLIILRSRYSQVGKERVNQKWKVIELDHKEARQIIPIKGDLMVHFLSDNVLCLSLVVISLLTINYLIKRQVKLLYKPHKILELEQKHRPISLILVSNKINKLPCLVCRTIVNLQTMLQINNQNYSQ